MEERRGFLRRGGEMDDALLAISCAAKAAAGVVMFSTELVAFRNI